MTTLADRLPRLIASLEAKYGPNNQAVKDLKKQLADAKRPSEPSETVTYRLQARRWASWRTRSTTSAA